MFCRKVLQNESFQKVSCCLRYKARLLQFCDLCSSSNDSNNTNPDTQRYFSIFGEKSASDDAEEDGEAMTESGKAMESS